MSRVSQFIKEQATAEAEFIRDEVRLRAKAVQVISEPFEYKGIRLSESITQPNEITVFSGLDRLHDAIGAARTDCGEIFRQDDNSYYFWLDGVKFVWQDWLGIWADRSYRTEQEAQEEHEKISKAMREYQGGKVMPYDD